VNNINPPQLRKKYHINFFLQKTLSNSCLFLTGQAHTSGVIGSTHGLFGEMDVGPTSRTPNKAFLNYFNNTSVSQNITVLNILMCMVAAVLIL
jgi:hypothetical protein